MVTIVTDNDQQMTHKHSQKMKEEEKTVCERLAAIKKQLTLMPMSIIGRHYPMDRNVLDHALKLRDDNKEKEKIASCKKDLEYAIKLHKFDQAKAQNPTSNDKKWRSCEDIKAYLQLLKCNEDPAWLTRRGAILYRSEIHY